MAVTNSLSVRSFARVVAICSTTYVYATSCHKNKRVQRTVVLHRDL